MASPPGVNRDTPNETPCHAIVSYIYLVVIVYQDNAVRPGWEGHRRISSHAAVSCEVSEAFGFKPWDLSCGAAETILRTISMYRDSMSGSGEHASS
jgi:hypothetical protein